MFETQLDRVGTTGDDTEESKEPAFLAGIWDSLSLLSEQKRHSSAENQNQASPKGTNTWSETNSTKSGQKNLNFRASVTVSEDEFFRNNPSYKGKLQDALANTDLRTRHYSSNEIDSGWRIHATNKDGSLELRKDYSISVKEKNKDRGTAKHSNLLESLTNVPDSHMHAIENKLAELPANILSALEKHGYKIVGTRTNTEAIPELLGKTPRGWAKNMSFDHSDGTHDNVRRLILAPILYKNEKNDLVLVERPDVVVHQIGHALDHALGRLSNSADFQLAFKKDMERLARKGFLMNEREKAIYDYFNQEEGPAKEERPGSEECFASLFGLILTGPENPEDRAVFESNFKSSIEATRKLIAKIK